MRCYRVGTEGLDQAKRKHSEKCEKALEKAKLAEQAERYEEMVTSMKEIVQEGVSGDALSVEERNLISVGYKNMMSVRRTAWRTILSLEEQEPEGPKQAMLAAYKDTIANELFELIKEVSKDIVTVYTEGEFKATNSEVLVFFHKMQGDYNRYGAEITSGDMREMYKNEATKSYKKAQDLSEMLKETNPIRLGLALNYSVFFYEICDKKDSASELAQAAFDNAIEKLDALNENEYRDCTLIMQLLKDNLALWSDELAPER